MPVIHLHMPAGTFPPAVLDTLADELTSIALDCEQLPTEPFDRSTACIYVHELPPERIYHGGQPGGTRILMLEVNIFRGGLDAAAKRLLYRRFTETIGRHAGIPEGARVPVYILVRENAPEDFGVFGETTSIEEVRRPHPDLPPL